MRQTSNRFTHSAARAVAAVGLFTALAFAAGPALAAKAVAAKAPSGDRVEARIKNMHATLKITHEQEEQWAKVAHVMRENAKALDTLTEARFKNVKTMNAIDDLKSYGEITDAHADGIKRFTPVFATLYTSMSDAQKSQADDLFRHGVHGKSKKSK
jgi:LTXXQ motif family protein